MVDRHGVPLAIRTAGANASDHRQIIPLIASEETVKFLVDAGADRTIRDANGDSPQSWASWHWRPKQLIDLLDPQNAT